MSRKEKREEIVRKNVTKRKERRDGEKECYKKKRVGMVRKNVMKRKERRDDEKE